jgi:hypothetical protein
MFTKIHDRVIQHDASRIMIMFYPHWGRMSHLQVFEQAHAVFCTHTTIPHRMCIVKNRSADLTSLKDKLDEIWSSYLIVDDGWRGSVQVTESDWITMQLTWM